MSMWLLKFTFEMTQTLHKRYTDQHTYLTPLLLYLFMFNDRVTRIGLAQWLLLAPLFLSCGPRAAGFDYGRCPMFCFFVVFLSFTTKWTVGRRYGRLTQITRLLPVEK